MSIQLSVSPEVHLEEFDDEIVVLHLGTEELFVLKGSAAVFLRTIRDHGDADEALAASAELYGVDAAVIRSDFEQVVSDLEQRHILAAG